MDVIDQKTAFFERLFSEMKTRGDLPSLQNAAGDITDTLRRETANLSDLTTLVLSDLSLSQKVITLANSEMHRAKGGEVTSISRAIMALGMTVLEDLSADIRTLDQFETQAGTHPAARAALKRASVAAAFVRALTLRHAPLAAEEAVLASLLLQLAPAMLALYFEHDWLQVLGTVRHHPGMRLSDACNVVFGVTLTELGAELAQRFGLPPELAESMEGVLPLPGLHFGSHGRWLSLNACLAAEVASMLEKKRGAGDIEHFLLPYLGMLGLDTAAMKRALAQATDRADHLVMEDIDVPLRKTAYKQAVFELPTLLLERLARAVTDIRATAPMLGSPGVMTSVVEQMGRCLNLESGYLLLHHAKDNLYAAKVGYGDGTDALLPKLRFDDSFAPDVFHTVTSNSLPMFFIDIQDDAVVSRIPEWHKDAFPDARSWVFVPVYLKDRCIALFCGTWGAMPLTRTLTGGEMQGLRELAAEISHSVERLARH